jgi:hypothetical protein
LSFIIGVRDLFRQKQKNTVQEHTPKQLYSIIKQIVLYKRQSISIFSLPEQVLYPDSAGMLPTWQFESPSPFTKKLSSDFYGYCYYYYILFSI